MNDRPLVTIACAVYNHGPFIRQCLDGLVMQKTNFRYEVVVHDDFSTDGSVDIIREYEKKYPEIIKPIYQDRNYGPGSEHTRKMKEEAWRGKYLAFCEGDDYWTDPEKLQTQVDFLESNPDYIICYHDSSIVDEHGNTLSESKLNDESKRDFSQDELIVGAWTLTNTICFRNVFSELPPGIEGDTFLVALLGQYGKGKYLSQIKPSAYRVHQSNTFGNRSDVHKLIVGVEIRCKMVRYYRQIGLDKRYEAQILRFANSLLENLRNKVDRQTSPEDLERLARLIPENSDILGEASLNIPVLNEKKNAVDEIQSPSPTFTVCIFTYNRAGMLPRAIKSVLADPHDDFELIVIDDGSTDETAELMAQFSDKRLRYFHQEHAGAPVARNLAIARSRGDYLIWLGSDDEIAPAAMEVYRREISNNPGVDIFYCDNVRLYETEGRQQSIRHQSYQGNIPPCKFLQGPPIADGGSCVRKSLYDEVGGYNDEFSRAQDYEFWVRARAVATFRHIREDLYLHHIHDKGSLSPLFYVNVDMSFENRVVDDLIRTYPMEHMHPEISWESLSDSEKNSAQALIYLEYASAYIKWGNASQAEHYLSQSKRTAHREEYAEVLKMLDDLKMKREQNTLPITAIIAAYNEGDVIYHVIRDLVEQDIDVVFIDHHSTDNTLEEVRKWEGKGVIRIERFPEDAGLDIPDDVYSWRYILRRKQEIAAELGPGWYLHTDADEFREAPWSDLNLRAGIERVDREGYNAIDFKIYDFKPTADIFEPGEDVRTRLTHYDPDIHAFNNVQVKCWKSFGQDVNLWESGGHAVAFEGRRVYPILFILRHYAIRSQSHGLQKVFQDRKARFDEVEREAKWHNQYDEIDTQDYQFIHDENTLIKYDRAEACAEVQKTSTENQGGAYYTFTRPEVQAMVAAGSQRILDVGCAAGKMAAELKQKHQAEVWGIEPVAEAASEAQSVLDKVICAGIEAALDQLPDQYFDTIIFADVLEHLSEPESVLRSMRSKLAPGGEIIASIPNIRHWSVLKDLLEGRWEYQDAGILDRTHLKFFTRSSIVDLLARLEFDIHDMQATAIGDDRAPEQVVKALAKTGIDVSSLAEESHHYQYLIKASPKAVQQQRADDRPLVSIIMLTWNALEYTQQCVRSIQENTEYPYEIVFVDNASEDGTRDYLAELVKTNPGYTLIQNEENQGFAAGNNQGVAAARGKYVLLLNNDVLVAKGWLNALVAAHELDESIGMVGPVTNYISGRQMVKDVPYESPEGFYGFAESVLKSQPYQIEPRRRIAGFAVLMEKALYEQVNGLDESFGSGNFEDDDLCLKVSQANKLIMVHEGVFLHHFGSQTFKANDMDYQASLIERGDLFRQKWPDVDYEELIETKDTLLERHKTLHEEALVKLDEGKIDEAAEDLASLLKEHPVHQGALLGEALILRRKGNVEEALARLTRIIQINPQHALAYNQAGIIVAESGDLEAAAQMLSRAIQNDPELVDAQRNYAEILLAQDEFPAAIQTLDSILTRYPDDVPTLIRMAELNLEADRQNDARDLLDKVMTVEPQHEAALAILDSMNGG